MKASVLHERTNGPPEASKRGIGDSEPVYLPLHLKDSILLFPQRSPGAVIANVLFYGRRRTRFVEGGKG